MYKGLLIELSNRRGQWRVRLKKPGGVVRATDGEVSAWISAPYMQRDFALEQVEALIDAAGCAERDISSAASELSSPGPQPAAIFKRTNFICPSRRKIGTGNAQTISAIAWNR